MLKLGNEFKNILDSEYKAKIVTGEIQPTNEFVDGKRVFVKRFNVGTLPNATRKTINIGLSSIIPVKIEGTANNTIHNTYITLPYNYGGTEVITISYLNGNLRVDSTVDSSQYVGWVNIYFTYN